MTDKALISDLTWRSLDMQRKAFPDMPYFVLPDDKANLIRPTRRNGSDNIHVLSLAVMADNERSFIEILGALRVRKAHIIDKETNTNYWPNCPIDNVINAWKIARRDGASKIGARISADKKKASTAQCIAKIKDRWPLPSKDVSTKTLLADADLSLNTVKSILGSRIIAQHNYQAKLKRRAKLKAASNAKYPRMKRANNYIDEAP